MYDYILIPGRHHILTQFQFDYFNEMLKAHAATDVHGDNVSLNPDASLVWAVTSSNHSNTRRNPFAGSRREAMIEGFASSMKADNYTFHINDLGTTPRFGDHIVKEIEVQSHGVVSLTATNTVVATSTPSIIKMFEDMGYRCLPVELDTLDDNTYHTLRAWEVAMAIVDAGSNWRDDATYQRLTHSSTKSILERYNLGDKLVEIYDDPLLGDEGDITENRDYDVYLQSFDEGAERKFELIQPHIKPGRILDIGCAGGSLIKCMSFDEELRESDLYGVEVARPLYERCMQRKSNGEFGNENVFFHQRNIMSGQVFPDNSLDTIISVSLTHEIESYIGRQALKDFIAKIHSMLQPGGIYINSDVVGPDNGDEAVLMQLTKDDGINPETPHEEFASTDDLRRYLESLSTYSRFMRFANDFRIDEEEQGISYKKLTIEGVDYLQLPYRDAAEFLLSKDYTNSWNSEMHERFCYFGQSDWEELLMSSGFKVDHHSNSYQNQWIINNRIKPVAQLYRQTSEGLTKIDYPPTNTLLIARKI